MRSIAHISLFGFFFFWGGGGLGLGLGRGVGGDYATKPIYFKLESGIAPIPMTISYYM